MQPRPNRHQTRPYSSLRESAEWTAATSWPAFVLLALVLMWVAHAIAFFAHEYAHSFTAWVLGWKTNPLALNYGHWSTGNVLAQQDIDGNVDYDPIFAAGQGVAAAVIAAAGMVIGNGLITYPISRWGFAGARRSVSRVRGLFFYWLCVASVGNFIDYVPTRTFASHGDMHMIVKGLHCSPWWIVVIFGIPFAAILLHFYLRYQPTVLYWLFPASKARRVILVVLSALALFGFYGAAGWSDYGGIVHAISMASVCLVLPLAIIIGIRTVVVTKPNAGFYR